jgi:hypothetical protein
VNGHFGYIIAELYTGILMQDGQIISLRPYQEAFHVIHGIAPNDIFKRDSAGEARIIVFSIANYYEGLKLPPDFKIGGTPYTLDTPSTFILHDFGPPTAGPVIRDFISKLHWKH